MSRPLQVYLDEDDAARGEFDGLPPDLSRRFDERLDATFVAEKAPAHRGKRERTRQRPRR